MYVLKIIFNFGDDISLCKNGLQHIPRMKLALWKFRLQIHSCFVAAVVVVF